jgi:NADH-quinone oxidoreductase subunit K
MLIYILLTIVIISIGIYGMTLSKKHVIIILISLELILLAININFLILSIYFDDIISQLYALLILTIAAAEISIGLAICIVHYRLRGGISIDYINLLKS